MSYLRTAAAPLLLTLLAYGLRLWRLDAANLRGDESVTLWYARQSAASIVAALRSAEPHPPAYYLSLHYWVRLVGDSEFALRYLSLFWGLLLVPLAYALLRALASNRQHPGSLPKSRGYSAKSLAGARGTAAIVAALVALSPFLLWHSQDTRMYTMLAALATASLLLATALLRGDRRRRTVVAYVGVTVLALLAHYAAAYTLLAEDAAVVLLLLSRRAPAPIRPFLWRWGAAQAAILLLYLPWLVLARGILGVHSSDWVQPVDLPSLLARLLLAFSLGQTIDPRVAVPLAFGFASLFLLGLAVWRRTAAANTYFAYLLVPVAALFVFSLRRPMFDERYLLAVLPLFLLAVAAGLATLARLRRPLAAGAGLFLLASTSFALWSYHFDLRFAKSADWRSAAAYLLQRAAEGDFLVVNYPDPSFGYYHRDRLPDALVPAQAPMDRARVRQTLDRLLAEQARLWLVPVQAANWDSDGTVEQWLDARGALAEEMRLRGVRLKLYLSPATLLQQQPRPPAVSFGGRVDYLGADLGANGSGAGTWRAGDEIRLALFFRATQELAENWKVYNHLLDHAGRRWGQGDGVPVQGLYPTTDWQPGEVVLDRYAIRIDRQTPPGHYSLRTGLYDADTGRRLSVVNARGEAVDDGIVAGEIEVSP